MSPHIQSMLTCVTALQQVKKGVYLKDHEEEEVGVGEPPELLEEVERQEGDNVVFGGLDGIVLTRRGERNVTNVRGSFREK